MSKNNAKLCFIGALFAVSVNARAHAYIDPGTGSILFSMISALLLTVLFSLKGVFYKLFFSLSGKKQNTSTDFSGKIVFFNEGKNYWKIFKPVLDELAQQNTDFVYLTADKDDPGLSAYAEKSFFIGTIQNAIVFLNKLKADVCVMTTPQLNILHLKRSPYVRHYCHLMHAPADIHTYKKFAFDYYDSVLCVNKNQIANIRQLEQKRGKPQKILFESGCTLFDNLPPIKTAGQNSQLAQSAQSVLSTQSVQALAQESSAQGTAATSQTVATNPQSVSDGATGKTVLIAPTWGEKSFLSVHGFSFITQILEQTDFTILFRPHPQSFISDSELMHSIEKTYQNNPRFLFDKNVNNIDSIDSASCMICDVSGVAFDFIFRKQKPIIVVDQTQDMYGYESADIENRNCLYDLLDETQSPVITDFSSIVTLLNNTEQQHIEKAVIDTYIFNYANAAPVIARQILSLAEEHRAKEKTTENPV